MKTVLTAVILAVGLGLSGGVYAAGPDTLGGADAVTPGANDVRSAAMAHPDMFKGKEVHSTSGKTIGEVNKLVRSNTTQDIYAVVSAGGFLGIGDKQVVVPLDALNMQSPDTIVMSQNAESMLKDHTYDADSFTDLKAGGTGLEDHTGTTGTAPDATPGSNIQ